MESPGSSANMGLGAAARFEVSGGSYSLSSVTLALGNIYLPGNNNLAISIFADNNGMPAGGLLETVVMHPTDLTADYLVVTYPSSLEPVLAGGSSYWLVAEPADLNLVNGDNNAAFSWYTSGMVGHAGYREFNFAAEAWRDWQINPDSLVPAFRIEGTPIPEPGTLSLLLLGAGLASYHGGRKRRFKANLVAIGLFSI
ncbi:MAG: PEP-CTERM sorting domain-containing protein [Verrucomicrobia bacterium]|nr:PEP-CTERM sorting domain-containing protein [Verrucomicrobiota bacterium]